MLHVSVAVQGEENTKYFQARATERLWRNAITNLVLPDGRLIENHDEKQQCFTIASRREWECHLSLSMILRLQT